ncbi:DUF3122 domain-containing protein [Geminocystis sp.]|uniref:DUF3122 domain-containing protein n=1 Tax=Geminocystis sp. TaxID=2664100 RepID=UPI00359398B9
MKKNIIKRIVLIILLAITINLSFTNISVANIIQQTETPEQILYQARNRLSDSEGNSWQLILFKRIKEGKTIDVNLRLVAFPETINFNHPQDLIINTLTSEDMKADDQFSEKAPANNVGQYNFQNILPKLTTEKSITLSLPVKEKSLTLKIPYPVLLEWQEIAIK